MSFDAWILVAIIAFAISAFVSEWLPIDVVALAKCENFAALEERRMRLLIAARSPLSSGFSRAC